MILDLKKTYGFNTAELNIGGGFGIRYTEEDDEQPYSYFLDPIMKMITDGFASIGLPCPAVVIEPGRSIVGNAGITLYTIGAIKNIPEVRKYISVDGGMTDNIRPALYEAKYECVLANKTDGLAADDAGEREDELVTISGKCCESGDVLIKNVLLPAPERGDLLAIFSTGAYCSSMSSNYNKIPFLPVVMTSDGKSRLIVKRQNYENMISREI